MIKCTVLIFFSIFLLIACGSDDSPNPDLVLLPTPEITVPDPEETSIAEETPSPTEKPSKPGCPEKSKGKGCALHRHTK